METLLVSPGDLHSKYLLNLLRKTSIPSSKFLSNTKENYNEKTFPPDNHPSFRIDKRFTTSNSIDSPDASKAASYNIIIALLSCELLR